MEGRPSSRRLGGLVVAEVAFAARDHGAFPHLNLFIHVHAELRISGCDLGVAAEGHQTGLRPYFAKTGFDETIVSFSLSA